MIFVISSALLKDLLLVDTTWKMLLIYDKEKFSTYGIILAKAILLKKSHRIWQDSRVDLATLRISSHFDTCVTLRASHQLLDSHRKLLCTLRKKGILLLSETLLRFPIATNIFFSKSVGSTKTIKKSELKIMISHINLDPKNLLRPWENDQFTSEI